MILNPALVAQYVEDFISLDAVTAIATGTATVTLEQGVIPSFVGDCQLASNASGDGAAVNTSNSRLFMDLSLGITTFQGRLQPLFGPPTALNDYRLILGFCNNFNPGAVGLGAFFLAGFTANGNANWWAIYDEGVPIAVDTGVAVNTGGPPQSFRINFEAITGATYFIDGVQVAFIANPSSSYPTIGVVAKYLDIGRGGDSCQLDYLAFHKILAR